VSQVPPGCETSPVQDAGGPHGVAAPGYTHEVASFPPHTLAQGPEPAQGACPGRGGPATIEHVPALPGSPHASQRSVHAESQHTPSAQKPETQTSQPAILQSTAGSHATPRALRALQVPSAAQYEPAEQPSSEEHVEGQVGLAPSHRYGAQPGALPGSPAVRRVHAPIVPTAHPWHDPEHAVSQHTPSAQEPLAQEVPPLHGSPFADVQAPAASQVVAPAQVSGSSASVTGTQAPAGAAQR
jgi:hypothetical protein